MRRKEAPRRGEGKARHPGARRRGQGGADRGATHRVEANRVEAGPRPLVAVGEARLEAPGEARLATRRRRGVERLGGRQEGEVAVQRAAGAIQMGEAEAGDVAVAIVVAAGVAIGGSGVGAPLDHAEGDGGAGEVVAAAEGAGTRLGAGEGIDMVGEARRGQGRNREADEQQHPQGLDERSSHETDTLRALHASTPKGRAAKRVGRPSGTRSLFLHMSLPTPRPSRRRSARRASCCLDGRSRGLRSRRR